MRTITMLVIHCSAVRPDQTSSAAQIDTWHRRDNHWKLGIGYHYVIRRNGTIEPVELTTLCIGSLIVYLQLR